MNMVKCLINFVHFEDQWTNCILIISRAQKLLAKLKFNKNATYNVLSLLK